MRIDVDHITVHNGGQVIAAVTRAFEQGDNVIDFSGVKRIDSSALAVLLAARRVLKSNKTLELQHRPEQLDSLIAAYGVQSLFS